MTTPLEVECLLDQAHERTGVAAFDNDSFVEGLTILVGEVGAGNGAASPNFEALVRDVEKWLDIRLRVSQYARDHPDVLETPIVAPIIILGAPRTGTTALSYMLDRDPRWRSLLNWEASDPVPPPTTATLRSDPRCVAKNEILRERLESMGDTAPVHWEWADGPTECNHIQSQDFRSQVVHTWVPSERYREFLYRGDPALTYEYQKKVLRILQSRAPGRWVLKSPSHALFLGAALDAFPDARLIVTHRNPFDVVASMYSMKARFLGVLTEEYAHAIRDTPRYTAEHLDRPVQLRAARPELDCFDVYMPDLVRAPVTELRRLYAWLGVELQPEPEAAMVAWLEQDSQRQSRRPKHSLADFGSSRAALAPLFEQYLAHDRAPWKGTEDGMYEQASGGSGAGYEEQLLFYAQRRDARVVEYQPYRHAGSGVWFRGPEWEGIRAGQYAVALGAADTVGCLCERPYARLIEDELGLPIVNLGYGGAGPAFYRTRASLLELINGARLAIVQTMSARGESNSRFEDTGILQRVTRRSDGAVIRGDQAWEEIARGEPPDRRERLLAETRASWVESYRALMTAIEAPTILFHFSRRSPDSWTVPSDIPAMMKVFPQFVTRAMLDEVGAFADRTAECISERGSPQRLVDRVTGAPVTIEAFPGTWWEHNAYYPSPEMHVDAAASLVALAAELT